jgi:hypothetical protein
VCRYLTPKTYVKCPKRMITIYSHFERQKQLNHRFKFMQNDRKRAFKWHKLSLLSVFSTENNWWLAYFNHHWHVRFSCVLIWIKSMSTKCSQDISDFVVSICLFVYRWIIPRVNPLFQDNPQNMFDAYYSTLQHYDVFLTCQWWLK